MSQRPRPGRSLGVAAKETEEFLSANNQGTAADAQKTGIDGDLVMDAMDRAFEAQGRVQDGQEKVQDLDTVRA